MSRTKLSIIFLSALLVLGCNNRPHLKEFTYKYTLENVMNYKIEFQINPDSTFQIIQNNYFFDRFENASRPKQSVGKLSKNEYDRFIDLLQNSNIFEMKDSYGFDDNSDTDNSILYIVELSQNGHTKFVSVNASKHQLLPEKFIELIKFTNEYLNKKLG